MPIIYAYLHFRFMLPPYVMPSPTHDAAIRIIFKLERILIERQASPLEKID
jgi:hypothetical protein